MDAWLDEQLSRQPINARESFNIEVLARLAQSDAVLEGKMDAILTQPVNVSPQFERNVFKRLQQSSEITLHKVLFKFAIPLSLAAALAIGLFVSIKKDQVKQKSPLSDFTDEQIALLAEIDFSEIASNPTPLSEKDLEILMLL